MARPKKTDIIETTSSGENPRQKALNLALAQIERACGKGAIMRMTGEIPKHPAISTGSLGLDIATGIGGLPRGRITEIYGPESSGKCLTDDTMVIGSLGMLTIKELFNQYGYKTTNTTKCVSEFASLVNEKAELEETSHFTWNGKKKVRKITSSIGNTLSPTYNHPVRVIDDNGFIVWKKAKDIKVGDILPMMRGTLQFGDSVEINEQMASLMGYLVADGSMGEVNKTCFSNSDKDIIQDYYNLITDVSKDLVIKSYDKKESKTIDHHINNKEFRKIVFDWGLDYVTAAEKNIPLSIRMAPHNIQKAFIRSYLECECSIDVNKRGLEVSSASHELLAQLQLMLLNFGFVGILSKKEVKDYGTYWRLTYSGSEGASLIEWIDFISEERIKKAELIPDEVNGSTNIDSIPNLGNLIQSLYNALDIRSRKAHSTIYDYMGDNVRANVTYNRLEKIVSLFGSENHVILDYFRDLLSKNYFYATVKDIEESEAPTFDVCLPRTHSFWSNGFISHNTTLTLHAIAEAQQAGLTCAFIDAEHALDPGYARKLGVNLEELLISQPDNGEQALEIASTLVNSGAVDLIVVDSVAALTPRAEIEGEMGDSHMGLHARLMSQALRKITGDLSRTNCTMIMINQIRMKIGVMFGNPETTTGGNALKFYASMRMDIRRIGSIKEKDEVVGNQTRVKIIKNKMAPPFRQVEFDIMYGKGIDRIGEIIDFGVKDGLVEKSGAWYSYDSQRIGQGRENTKTFLREHEEMCNEIEQKILADKETIVNDIFIGDDHEDDHEDDVNE